MNKEAEQPEKKLGRKQKKENQKKEKQKKTLKQEIFEWIMVFIVAAAIAFPVRTFIFEPVRVDGSSMLNTLTDSEFMIATKFDYLFGDPERFDIVICHYPNTTDGMYRVKRVIGLPGETVELRMGKLYVNGEFVEQDFDMTPNQTNFGPITVPADSYFVLGDNRNNSKDSRSAMVGPLERDMIKGHVRAVVFPFGNFRFIAD